MMCLLIQANSLLSSSCSSVQLTQSGLLQCTARAEPPCHLLHLGALLPRVRDSHPLELNPFGLYLPFKAHTKAKINSLMMFSFLIDQFIT